MSSHKIRKFDFCLSLIIALGLMFMTIKEYKGIYFPQKKELKYTKGIFNIENKTEAINYIRLEKINNRSS